MRTMLALMTMALLAGTLAAQIHIQPKPNPNPTPTPPPNNAPIIAVNFDGSNVTSGSTVQVAFGESLQSKAVSIVVVDSDTDPCVLQATINYVGNTGIMETEWESALAGVPLNIAPNSGTFNDPNGATHIVSLTASDGLANTPFVFTIQQLPNNAPSLSVATTASGVTNGGTIAVSWSDTLAGLGLGISADDAEGNDVSVSATVSNLGNTGMVVGEFESTSAATPYVITPTSGVFNTPVGATHQVDLIADDGNATSTFTFYVQQALLPAPLIEVLDGGVVISYDQPAASTNRQFPARDVGTGPSAPVTITIGNYGGADLNLSNFGMTGSTSAFVLDLNNLQPVVAPGATTSFDVVFEPQLGGAHSAFIEFTHDDTFTPAPFRFEVSGVANAPQLLVWSSSSPTTAMVNGDVYDFGAILVENMPSLPVTFHVENIGTTTMQLGVPASTGGGFFVDATNFPSSLAVGAGATFVVTFNSTVPGNHTATVTFNHNDPSVGVPFDISLKAAVVDPYEPGLGNEGQARSPGGCVAQDGTALLWGLCLLGILGAAILRRRTA